MTVAKHTSPPFIYSGLSSDTKPDATVLSVFVETDTGDEFIMLSNWTQCKDALSQFATLSTLLSGETHSDSSGGWMFVNAGAPVPNMPDLTTGQGDYTPYADTDQYILGIKYYGTGGVLIGTDELGDERTIKLVNAVTYGPQVEPIHWKSLYNVDNGSTCIGSTTDILCYLSKPTTPGV